MKKSVKIAIGAVVVVAAGAAAVSGLKPKNTENIFKIFFHALMKER